MLGILQAFVYFIFVVKLVFIVLVVIEHVALRTELYQSILVWKNAFENVFLACVSFLCLYVFFPYRKTPMTLTAEMQFLFFVYGIIVLYELLQDRLLSTE